MMGCNINLGWDRYNKSDWLLTWEHFETETRVTHQVLHLCGDQEYIQPCQFVAQAPNLESTYSCSRGDMNFTLISCQSTRLLFAHAL